MKIDPYNHKQRYLSWKEKSQGGIEGLSPQNSEIILSYLNNMEKGINVSAVSVKGGRSYCRLNSLKERLTFFSKKFEELYGLKRLTEVSEEQLISFFADMKSGLVKRKDGKNFRTTDTAGKIFKAFWHWHQKTSKKNGIEIPDITIDLDTRAEKPRWVYLTEKEVKILCDNAKPNYKLLIMFLFDTGIRAPGELINLKVSDFYNDFKELNIREETSKTFGRRIKLMICSDLVKEYIQSNGLIPEDHPFSITPTRVNEYLKRLAKRTFGDKITLAGEKYSNLTMYDFRHVSCCYWLPRYKSESALKYRFGWKKSDKIHYYSELLGMKDTISEEDMLIDLTKTDIEQKLIKADKKNEILSDRLRVLEEEMKSLKKISLQVIEASPLSQRYNS